MGKSLVWCPVALTVLLLSGCDEPAGAWKLGWLRASISGTTEGSYAGSGDFLVQTDREEGPRKMFTLNSVSDSLQTEAFGFTRQNGTRPRPGRYPLELVGPHNQDGDRFYAGYHRVKDGRYEDYVATTGWIEIASSSDDRVEGTFYPVGKQ